MRAILVVAFVLVVSYVQTYHRSPKQARTPEHSSVRATDGLPPIDLEQCVDLVPVPSKEWPSEALWTTCWFGDKNRIARMVSTTPKGLAVVKLYRGGGGPAGYPSYADIKTYLCDIGKVSFSYAGSSMHVGKGIEWYEAPPDPRFPDVVRPSSLWAPSWPGIRRFDLQRSGDLLADVPPPELGIWPEEPSTYRLLISR